MIDQGRNKAGVLYVRISPSLKKTLKEFCKRKGVSMTDYVEALVSKSIKRN